MTKPLQVSFVKETREALFREAERRNLRPQVLVAAAIRGMLAGGLLDAVMDGDNPRALAGGHARDISTGLTLLQEGVLYLIGVHAGKDGSCRLSISALQARLAGASWNGVQNALAALCTRGLIRRRGTASRLAPQPYALTPAGQEIFRTLADSEAEGGEG